MPPYVVPPTHPQALYFIPSFRAAVLSHTPEPDAEFCLACELLFLFRMMLTSEGTPCRASHLLRALRQNREAAALGLLEGSGGGTAGGAAVCWCLLAIILGCC